MRLLRNALHENSAHIIRGENRSVLFQRLAARRQTSLALLWDTSLPLSIHSRKPQQPFRGISFTLRIPPKACLEACRRSCEAIGCISRRDGSHSTVLVLYSSSALSISSRLHQSRVIYCVVLRLLCRTTGSRGWERRARPKRRPRYCTSFEWNWIYSPKNSLAQSFSSLVYYNLTPTSVFTILYLPLRFTL